MARATFGVPGVPYYLCDDAKMAPALQLHCSIRTVELPPSWRSGNSPERE
jgi:hypothetical protein